jgi:hypothetical protein
MPDFMSLKPRQQVAGWCAVMLKQLQIINKFSPLMEPKGSLLWNLY